MKMRYPVLILSDLHLGHPASDVRCISQLRPLIQGAGTVIFNGDSWQELAIDLREESGKLLSDLKALCAELGAETLFLPGNHDPNISDQLYVELLGGKVAVFHGDVIFPEVSPWSTYYLAQQGKIDTLIKEELRADSSLEERYALAHKVVNAMKPVRKSLKGQPRWKYYTSMLFPPKRAWLLANVKRIAKKQTRIFSEQYFPHAEVVVFGHFHLPLSEKMGTKRIINTGAFMAGCKVQAVEVTPDSLQVIEIIKDADGNYTRGAGKGLL